MMYVYAIIFVYDTMIIIIIIMIVISVMEELFQENTSEYTVFDFNLNNLFG